MIKEDAWTLHGLYISLRYHCKLSLAMYTQLFFTLFLLLLLLLFVSLSLSHSLTHTHTCSFHHELPSEAFASPLHIPDEESMRADYTPPESPIPAIFDLTSIPINDKTPLPPIDEPV